MTEPNEPATPLSRMRFSWQRGAPTPDERPPHDDAPADNGVPAPAAPDPGPEAVAPQPVDAGPSVPAAAHDEAQQRWAPPYATEPAPQATRLGRAAPEQAPAERLAPERPGTARVVQAEAFPDIDEALDPRYDSRTQQTRAGRERQPQPDRRSRPTRGAPARGGFDVPAPGKRFSSGRGAHAAVRVGLILTTCLLVLGVVGYAAFVFGSESTQPDDNRLSADDIDRYRLTDFPLQQAGRFAADYARICLAHSDQPDAQSERQAQLARYLAEGSDPTCGWSGDGIQEVVDSSWTGASEPIEVTGYAGHARMMTVRVLTLVNGQIHSRVLAVPVYVSNLESGEGMRIVGDLGEMPQPLLAGPPEATPVGGIDQKLTDALLEGQFFRQFFDAWGKSDAPSLNRFVSADATDRATAGLSGNLTEPVITKAQVFLPKGRTPGEFTWSEGDQAEAWVWVTWKNQTVGADVTQTRAYRLQLTLNEGTNPAQSWAVRDVRGGVPHVGTQ